MKKKIVFIGNSIVNGFPLKRSECFASKVREETGWEVINKGNNGETTSQILTRFQNDVIARFPNTVFILTGTNDFIFEEASVEEAFKNLINMANLAAGNGIKTVFMTPIPVDEAMASKLWMPEAGVDYFRVNTCLEELSEKIKSSGTKFIDLNNLYRPCGKYIDGVHPTAEGHRYIAGIISKYIKDNLMS